MANAFLRKIYDTDGPGMVFDEEQEVPDPDAVLFSWMTGISGNGGNIAN